MLIPQWLRDQIRTIGEHKHAVLDIPQAELLRLAEQWEPEASASPPGYRMATCAGCGTEMVEMWHCWLHEGGFKKEIHLCWACGEPWLRA